MECESCGREFPLSGFVHSETKCKNCLKVCPECEGDGLVIVGWDADAYENIEGKCPKCNGTGQVDLPPQIKSKKLEVVRRGYDRT